MKLIKIFLSLSVLFSCTQKPAPILNRSKATHIKSNIYNKSNKNNTSQSSDFYYEVKKGDTIYSISKAHNMGAEDLAKTNNVSQPYQLNVGQKILLQEKKITPADKKITESHKKPELEPSPKENIEIVDKNNKFLFPIKGQIVSKFGPKKGGLYNDGINIKANEGAKIKASEDGVVAYVGNELKGYGNLIIIKHSGGWITAYGHLSKTLIKKSDRVKKSQIIGAAGSTGNVSFPQLYFGIRKGREAMNPENYGSF
jgi:murein DD-endopeptidase MepM/ murein hydrolase activator NlpD